MKTLQDHFQSAKAFETYPKRSSLNAFAAEIERDKVAFDRVSDQIPSLITEPYGEVEFSDQYHSPSGLQEWEEMKQEGFENQPIPGLEYGMTWDWDIARSSGDMWWIGDFAADLPYSNDIFAKTIRFHTVEDSYGGKPYGRWFDCNGEVNESDIWAFTHHDADFAKESHRKDRRYFAYKVGKAHDLVREPTEEEIEEMARKPMIHYVFGIEPPKESEVIDTLRSLHGFPSHQKYVFRWTDAKSLDYPIPRGVRLLYKDAKDSGLFTELSFGVLEKENRRSSGRDIVDPVLAGTYQGYKIPLSYWA